MEFLRADVAEAVDIADRSAGPELAPADAAAAPPSRQPTAEPGLDGEGTAPSAASLRPQVEHLAPVTGASPTNLASSAAVHMGGAFSFMCTARMDGIDNWSRMFDFSLNADEDSITAGAIELTHDLHFTVFRGRKPFSVRVNNFFTLGQEFAVLLTVSASGHMRVYKDGALVGENKEGMALLPLERPRMIVGGHFQFLNQTFRGVLNDVKVWDQEVSWPAPVSVEAPTAEAEKAPPADVPVVAAAVAQEGGVEMPAKAEGGADGSDREVEEEASTRPVPEYDTDTDLEGSDLEVSPPMTLKEADALAKVRVIPSGETEQPDPEPPLPESPVLPQVAPDLDGGVSV